MTNALDEQVFDNLYRLTSENIFGGAVNGTVNYTFDAVSNRTSRSSTVARVSNQTHTHTDNDWLAHHSYDDNGSTTTSPDLVNGAGDVHDIYDFRNKLIRRTSDNGDVIEFLYNADGHRVNKSIGSGGVLGIATEYRYLVDSNNPTGYSQVVEEKNTNGILTRSYHLGHQRFAMTDHTNGGDISYYNFDGHGSIRGLSNENGDVVEEYDFDSYGILIGFRKDTGSGMIDHDPSQLGGLSRNEFLFAGEQWDADMGMYYNRARYYDVENGRFNAMDDWEGNSLQPVSLNKYLYTHGNPIMGIDPSGNINMTDVMSTMRIIANMAVKTGRAILRVARNIIKGKRWEMRYVEASPLDHTFIYAKNLRNPVKNFGYHVLVIDAQKKKKLFLKSRKLKMPIAGIFAITKQTRMNYVKRFKRKLKIKSFDRVGYFSKVGMISFNLWAVPSMAEDAFSGGCQRDFAYVTRPKGAIPPKYQPVGGNNCISWSRRAVGMIKILSLL